MSALPRSACCALALLACRHVGEVDASDTQDSMDSGETQHSAEDTGDDSDMLAVCVPDDGKIRVACPYTIPAEYYPADYDSADSDDRPVIGVRTGWWIPLIWEDDASATESVMEIPRDPVPAVGAMTCCVPALIEVLHAYGWVWIAIGGPSTDASSCHFGIFYQSLAGYGVWDVDTPDWAGVLECNIPLPWDPPSWLYSSNSPLYGEIPAGCHPYIPQEGAPSRLPGLVGRDFFETLRSRAVEAP